MVATGCIHNAVATAPTPTRSGCCDSCSRTGQWTLFTIDRMPDTDIRRRASLGLNDTAAFRLADVSMSPSAALDVPCVTAGILIMGGLDRVPEGIRLAGLATVRILQNFAVAAIYNAVAVPVAMLGFAAPLAAAIARSTSSTEVNQDSMRMH